MLDMEMFYELVLIAIDTTDELSKVYFHVEQIDLANMHFNKKHVNFTWDGTNDNPVTKVLQTVVLAVLEINTVI